MNAPIVLLMAITCAVVVAALACIRRIPEGHAYTLKRVDGHLRTVGAGLHLVVPLLERVKHKIRLLGNVVEVVAEVEGQRLNGRVYFQILDAQRADAVIDRIADLVRERVPSNPAPRGTGTEDTAAHLKAALNRDLAPRGVLVTRVQLG